MNDKPSPIAGSAPEERQSRFRQRRATGKALVVERVGRASKGREDLRLWFLQSSSRAPTGWAETLGPSRNPSSALG